MTTPADSFGPETEVYWQWSSGPLPEAEFSPCAGSDIPPFVPITNCSVCGLSFVVGDVVEPATVLGEPVWQHKDCFRAMANREGSNGQA